MLFALFFGAGNLIFPPMLGQLAGTNLWTANAGFSHWSWIAAARHYSVCVFGKNDLQSLAGRVHPLFGLVFTVVLYLAIGPFLRYRDRGVCRLRLGLNLFYLMIRDMSL